MSRLSLTERKSALKYGKIKDNSLERELPEIEKARGVNKGAQAFLDRGGTHAVLVDVLKKLVRERANPTRDMTYESLAEKVSTAAGTAVDKKKLYPIVKEMSGSLDKLKKAVVHAKQLHADGKDFTSALPKPTMSRDRRRILESEIAEVAEEIEATEREVVHNIGIVDQATTDIGDRHAIPMEKVLPIAKMEQRDENYYPQKVKIQKRVPGSNVVEAPKPVEIKKEEVNRTAKVTPVLKKLDNVEHKQHGVQLRHNADGAIGDMLKKLGY